MANKVIDINSEYGGKSDKANQLNYEVFIDKFKPLRTPKINVKRLFKPTEVNRLPQFIINTYKLSGLEFGNWVNQVRRLDYCLSTIIAFYDLQKVLQIKNNNLGLNKAIGMAYGARGAAGALAHYEPSTDVINLSRDRRIDKIKKPFSNMPIAVYSESEGDEWERLTNKMREQRSGYGSIAHEYGHALDYVLSRKYTKGRSTALSGGSTTLFSYKGEQTAYSHFLKAVYNRKEEVNELEQSFIDCFEPFLFTKGKPTGYYRRVYEYAARSSTYWSRLNEIWARIFETYIAYKLSKTGIKDNYLVRAGKGKYRVELGKNALNVYPTFGEMGKHYRKIDKFITVINKYI
jgi:hypothetical protein